MILPWLRGFLDYSRAPVTIILIGLNIFVYFLTLDASPWKGTAYFEKTENLILTAKLYYEYKGQKGLPLTDDINFLASKALKDKEFLTNSKSINFSGDQIAIQEWKNEIVKFLNLLSDRSSAVFGLSLNSNKPLTWLTYQFSHAGLLHLFSNMLFFWIFGAALESIVGGIGLLVVYVLSGFAGAIGFLLFSDPTIAPMVGASGALSGVMSFYMLSERKKRIPFFYFLSPMEGYFGWIYLPTLMLIPLCFISDFAAYFSSIPELGSGVAYTAHIGGILFGVFSYGVYKYTMHFFKTTVSS